MTARPSPRRLRQLLPVLLLALAFAQTLGAMHRIVHTPNHGGGAARAATTTPSPMTFLFAGHASEQGCDLFDQLSHADFLPAVAVALAPLVPIDATTLPVQSRHRPVEAASFLARGPPRTA